MGKNIEKCSAVFIDRDGTLIKERNYLSKIKDIRLIKGAVEAMRLLLDAGYRLILITNQSGIARGYFTEKKLLQIHAALNRMLYKKGVSFDAIYYCPHGPDDNCGCRKPGLELIKKAEKKFNLDLSSSYTIGDHAVDFLLGNNMGGKGIFVLTGHGKKELLKIKSDKGSIEPDFIEKNIYSAARLIVNQSFSHEKKNNR